MVRRWSISLAGTLALACILYRRLSWPVQCKTSVKVAALVLLQHSILLTTRRWLRMKMMITYKTRKESICQKLSCPCPQASYKMNLTIFLLYLNPAGKSKVTNISTIPQYNLKVCRNNNNSYLVWGGGGGATGERPVGPAWWQGHAQDQDDPLLQPESVHVDIRPGTWKYSAGQVGDLY